MYSRQATLEQVFISFARGTVKNAEEDAKNALAAEEKRKKRLRFQVALPEVALTTIPSIPAVATDVAAISVPVAPMSPALAAYVYIASIRLLYLFLYSFLF